MAITTNALESSPKTQGTITSIWRVNASTSDGSGGEELKAAPGAGYELVVNRIFLTISGNATVTIGQGEESNTCKYVLLGPLGGAAMSVALDFGDDVIVLNPNTSLTIDASGAATVWVCVEGFTRVAQSAGVASNTPSASVSASPSESPSASPSASVSASPSASISASPSASASA